MRGLGVQESVVLARVGSYGDPFQCGPARIVAGLWFHYWCDQGGRFRARRTAWIRNGRADEGCTARTGSDGPVIGRWAAIDTTGRQIIVQVPIRSRPPMLACGGLCSGHRPYELSTRVPVAASRHAERPLPHRAGHGTATLIGLGVADKPIRRYERRWPAGSFTSRCGAASRRKCARLSRDAGHLDAHRRRTVE